MRLVMVAISTSLLSSGGKYRPSASTAVSNQPRPLCLRLPAVSVFRRADKVNKEEKRLPRTRVSYRMLHYVPSSETGSHKYSLTFERL